MYQDVLSVKDYKAEFKAGKAAILNANDFGVVADDAAAVKKSVNGDVEAVTFFKQGKGREHLRLPGLELPCFDACQQKQRTRHPILELDAAKGQLRPACLRN